MNLFYQKGEILAQDDFYSSPRPHCSGRETFFKNPARYTHDLVSHQAAITLERHPPSRRSECGHCEQPAGSCPKRLPAGGQREGVVRLPQDPPAPSIRLRHPPVQP